MLSIAIFYSLVNRNFSVWSRLFTWRVVTVCTDHLDPWAILSVIPLFQVKSCSMIVFKYCDACCDVSGKFHSVKDWQGDGKRVTMHLYKTAILRRTRLSQQCHLLNATMAEKFHCWKQWKFRLHLFAIVSSHGKQSLSSKSLKAILWRNGYPSLKLKTDFNHRRREVVKHFLSGVMSISKLLTTECETHWRVSTAADLS